ncbi:hypothetical protein QBC37DRAFT_117067 [Rhypophila decipiens]|uniref:Uncharacterized protein n=1 Tax=Rhypophila decipiens TaxID=261697 RepID=A0AAN6YBV6_9PEZI|nr:hypothetical protein QBC37DRAFT_117067 [Rhypophila decipiens]
MLGVCHPNLGDSGVQLLRTLQTAVLEVGEVHYASLHCTTVSVIYTDEIFHISARGSPVTIIEVGEQLAWLTAALRSSPRPGIGIASCIPTVTVDHISSMPNMPVSTVHSGPVNFGCRIQVNFDDPTAAQSDIFDFVPGCCWHKCFRNPVVLRGYPIPRRPETGSGLEVSIGIMTSLANARYQVVFGRRSVLKGFSTMLTVSKVREDIVFWRLFYNEDGSYISYEDVRVPRIQSEDASLALSEAAISAQRHILGWCEKVENLAGSAHANYDIGWSGLPPPSQSFAWDKISISIGKILNVGAGISFGIKDKPEHISYDEDYISTVDTIANRYFVFYDIEDKRAFLLDGASALLHLLRAFIRHSLSNRRRRHVCLFDPEEFQNDPPEELEKDAAAFWVLVNEQNQLHPLWKLTCSPSNETSIKVGKKLEQSVTTTSTYFCIKDKVLQICRVLQQIAAHQDDVHTRAGVGSRIKLTPRRQLEGFDFMDIATTQGTIWPNVAELHAKGAGWVDFRAGNPRGACFRHPIWRTTETGRQDPVSDVHRGSKKKQNLWRVVDNIYWHMPDKAFEPCKCVSPAKSRSQPRSKPQHDRVQVLLPSLFPRFWGRGLKSPCGVLPDQGALLFGHSWRFPLRWGATAIPTEGEPDCLPDSSDRGSGLPELALMDDSGLGSSVQTSDNNTPLSRSRGEPAEDYGMEMDLDDDDDDGTFVGNGGPTDFGMYLHPNRALE